MMDFVFHLLEIFKKLDKIKIRIMIIVDRGVYAKLA